MRTRVDGFLDGGPDTRHVRQWQAVVIGDLQPQITLNQVLVAVSFLTVLDPELLAHQSAKAHNR